jgi:hypothetical protein
MKIFTDKIKHITGQFGVKKWLDGTSLHSVLGKAVREKKNNTFYISLCFSIGEFCE